MKKLIKAILFTALIMSALTFTSFAATYNNGSWEAKKDGNWGYLDKSGEAVESAFVHYNGNIYYINEDGLMVTNKLVEDNGFHYFNGEGQMVKDAWIWTVADEDDDEAVAHWMYFDKNGNRKENGKLVKNGKTYLFYEGIMQYGFCKDGKMIDADVENPWIDADSYYGPESYGAMLKKGWLAVEKVTDTMTFEGWIYFDENGAKVEGEAVKSEGIWYVLDEDGFMLAQGWNGNRYFLVNGQMKKNGWEYISDNRFDAEAKSYWYYFLNDGSCVKSQIKKIGNKYYAFDEDGKMIENFFYLDNGTPTSIMFAEIEDLFEYDSEQLYFAEKTGIVTIKKNISYKGEELTYYAEKNGKAFTGIKSNLLYINGLLVNYLDADSKYVVIYVEGDEKLLEVETGKIKNAGTYADFDGYFNVAKDGEITFSIEKPTKTNGFTWGYVPAGYYVHCPY